MTWDCLYLLFVWDKFIMLCLRLLFFLNYNLIYLFLPNSGEIAGSAWHCIRRIIRISVHFFKFALYLRSKLDEIPDCCCLSAWITSKFVALGIIPGSENDVFRRFEIDIKDITTAMKGNTGDTLWYKYGALNLWFMNIYSPVHKMQFDLNVLENKE